MTSIKTQASPKLTIFIFASMAVNVSGSYLLLNLFRQDILAAVSELAGFLLRS